MPHHRPRHPVPRSDPPPSQRPHRQRVALTTTHPAKECPACGERDCATHRKGRAETLEGARALLAGADGVLCRDQEGRWHAYLAVAAQERRG